MTCEGQILAGLADDGGETTPLQDKLEVIATDIGKLGMLAALLIFHALLLRQFVESLLTRRFDLQGGPAEYYYYDQGTYKVAKPCKFVDGTNCDGSANAGDRRMLSAADTNIEYQEVQTNLIGMFGENALWKDAANKPPATLIEVPV
jgi:hypothetical protein